MKFGLGQSYDRVQILSKKSRAYIDLTKPASSVGVGLGYLIGSLFFFAYTSDLSQAWVNIDTILYVCLTIFFAHSASQAMNMAEDAEMDALTEHKKNRPIPAGIVSVEEARTLAWILSAFALGRGFMVNWRFGTFVMVLLGFGIFYNLDPIRAKERAISIPWQAISRGLLSFPAIWAAYGDPTAALPWVLGLFMFFYVLGFQNSADIIDRHVDADYGINTFVVMFGVQQTVNIAAICTFLMAVIISFSVYINIIPYRFMSMYIMLPFCGYMLYTLATSPYDVSELTGNHPSWLWFYGGMVLAVVIPLVTELYV